MKEILPLWVGLTTLPSRINSIKPTLTSLLNQTVKPNKIFLSIPMRSIREGTGYELPEWLAEFAPTLEIIRCQDDFGPGTKLLGCLSAIDQPGCLVIADDDMIYRPFFLENLLYAQTQDKKSSFSYWTYKLGPITVGQGADGFSFYTPNLHRIEKFAQRALRQPSIRLNDDLWISSFLLKNGIPVQSIRNTIPDEHDVYIVSHTKNQLQDLTGNQSRQTINQLGMKYLLIRGYAGYPTLINYAAKALIRRTLKLMNP